MARFARTRSTDGTVGYVEIDAAGGTVALDAAPWAGGRQHQNAPSLPLASLELMVPVEPSKIICVGRNYRAHAAELGNEVPEEPLLFFKPPSALLAHGGDVVLPEAAISERVEHEVELGVVVGRRLTRATIAEAKSALFGYTIVADITARDLQRRDKLWTRGKGIDTFCPVGPWITTGIDAADLAISCSVNGEQRQHGRTSAMVHAPAEIAAYISRVMTLEPGDLIATGTPAGVGPLTAGDAVRMIIESIGALEFGVSKAAAAGGHR